MARIRVTPEELGAASQAVAALSEEYSGIYTQLLQQAGTMGEAWEATDNIAFVDQINGFCEELKMMSDKLRVASDALKQQQTNYASQQESNITQVRKLAN